MTDAVDKAKAAALFQKEQQAREGQIAMADYEAQAIAVRERMARLKAFRLAQPTASALYGYLLA